MNDITNLWSNYPALLVSNHYPSFDVHFCTRLGEPSAALLLCALEPCAARQHFSFNGTSLECHASEDEARARVLHTLDSFLWHRQLAEFETEDVNATEQQDTRRQP